MTLYIAKEAASYPTLTISGGLTMGSWEITITLDGGGTITVASGDVASLRPHTTTNACTLYFVISGGELVSGGWTSDQFSNYELQEGDITAAGSGATDGTYTLEWDGQVDYALTGNMTFSGSANFNTDTMSLGGNWESAEDPFGTWAATNTDTTIA